MSEIMSTSRMEMLNRTAEYLQMTRKVKNQKMALLIGRIFCWLLFLGTAILTKSFILGGLALLLPAMLHFVTVVSDEVEPTRKAFLIGILRNYLIEGTIMDDLERFRSKTLNSSKSDFDKETDLMKYIDSKLTEETVNNELTFATNIRRAYTLLNTDTFEANLITYFAKIRG